MRWPSLAMLLLGCGRIGFEAGDLELGEFSAPTLLVDLNSTTADDDPTLTGDMLEIVFDTERISGSSDLFVSTRSSLGAPWSTPTVIAELADPADDDAPCLSSDGLTITFSSVRGGSKDLYASTRATRTTAWTTPILIAELSVSGSDDERFCSDGARLHGILESSRDGFEDLYVTSRATVGDAWAAPRRATELATGMANGDPMLDETGEVLVFARNQDGNLGIWLATRPAVDAPFGEPVLLVDSAIDDTDPWLSPDRRTLVYTCGSSASTNRDLCIATR